MQNKARSLHIWSHQIILKTIHDDTFSCFTCPWGLKIVTSTEARHYQSVKKCCFWQGSLKWNLVCHSNLLLRYYWNSFLCLIKGHSQKKHIPSYSTKLIFVEKHKQTKNTSYLECWRLFKATNESCRCFTVIHVSF